VVAVLFVVFCTTFASNGPSILYVVYQGKYHFTSLTVTAIFSVYAVAVLATLLVVGRLSDVVGRRPLLLAGAALLVASALLFALARSALWLFAARALQGVATGTLIAAAGASLVELSPPRQRPRAALMNTVAFLTGAAAGSLAFGVMVQFLPSPTVLPYVLEIALDGGALLAVAVLVIETVTPGEHARWRLQRPSVPRAILRPFVVSSVTMGVGWSLGGVYGALSPTMTRQILHVSSHLVAGAVLCTFNLVGGVAQLLRRRHGARGSMLAGLALVALGAALIQLAFTARSSLLLFLATLFGGAGAGMAFVGSLALVNELAPAARRAEALAAYNLVGYLALSLPVIGVGLLTSALGLRTASLVFCCLLVAAAGLLALPLRRVGVAAEAVGERGLGARPAAQVR